MGNVTDTMSFKSNNMQSQVDDYQESDTVSDELEEMPIENFGQ
jgi:ASC-1-like (ASCH) protein